MTETIRAKMRSHRGSAATARDRASSSHWRHVVATQSAAAQNAERSGKEVVDSAVHRLPRHRRARRAEDRRQESLGEARGARPDRPYARARSKASGRCRRTAATPDLTDTEIERAITYMVNQSGGHWTEPVSRTTKAPERTGEQIVQARCSKCHQDGVGGAPKIGDRSAWIPRFKPGLDVVVRSAINGHGGMPARGGMANLTDAEMRSAIIYMFNKGTVPPKAP